MRKACEESLSKLGLEYVDLYLVHFPAAFHLKEGYEKNYSDPNCFVYEDIALEDTWKVRL